MSPSAVFSILHWWISWSWPENFHDTNSPLCERVSFIYSDSMLFVVFFYFCVMHTDLFTGGNTVVTTLCCWQQMSSALYLTDFVSASISWLLGVQVLLVLPRYPLILLCVWFPALPLGPMVCCRTPSSTSFFSVSKEHKHTFTCIILQTPVIMDEGEINSFITMCITVALLCSHVNSKEQLNFYSFDTI